MKDEILDYLEMCRRERMSLQRGMYFKSPPAHGVILMSRRHNAPYADALSDDEKVLIYEGHDVYRTKLTPNPKKIDQPRTNTNGRPTENGRFASWVDAVKENKARPAIFRVYEKMIIGVWTDRGLYILVDYSYPRVNDRHVFKFHLEQADFDTTTAGKPAAIGVEFRRQIPSSVKQEVFKRDDGKCVICGAKDQIHFDHDLPFSKGGTSILADNVRILCARHNLAKSAKIE